MTGLSVSIFKDSAYENGNDSTNDGFSSQRTRSFVFSDVDGYMGNYSIDDI